MEKYIPELGIRFKCLYELGVRFKEEIKSARKQESFFEDSKMYEVLYIGLFREFIKTGISTFLIICNYQNCSGEKSDCKRLRSALERKIKKHNSKLESVSFKISEIHRRKDL